MRGKERKYTDCHVKNIYGKHLPKNYLLMASTAYDVLEINSPAVTVFDHKVHFGHWITEYPDYGAYHYIC